MSRRLVSILVLFAAVAAGVYFYRQYRNGNDDGSGTVRTEDGSIAKPESSTADSAISSPAKTQPARAVPPQPVQPPVTSTDSIAPNPPNGATFGGSGKYQLYRQGSLTWRLDTETGRSCILFATMAEWRKPIVYTHGCNNS